jgi:hypothetical protein
MTLESTAENTNQDEELFLVINRVSTDSAFKPMEEPKASFEPLVLSKLKLAPKGNARPKTKRMPPCI